MSTMLANTDLASYLPIVLIVLMAITFAVANIGASIFIGPRRDGKIKQQIYESGMAPVGSARKRFNVRFYLIAMVFLVFDVEIVILYPWAVVFPSLARDSALNTLMLARMFFFILTSIIAFVYAWRKGVFRYD